MKLSALKQHLSTAKTLNFLQPNGAFVPTHFHITEVGLTTKHFIDCGGVIHNEKLANLQIWVANDTEHRLKPMSLLNIIDISEQVLGDEDLEIEVEYQTETVGRYGLEHNGQNFMLTAKQTDCLARVKCDTPQASETKNEIKQNSCKPNSGCC